MWLRLEEHRPNKTPAHAASRCSPRARPGLAGGARPRPLALLLTLIHSPSLPPSRSLTGLKEAACSASTPPVQRRRSFVTPHSGGPSGYAELLEAMKTPGHPRHSEFLEWAG